MVFSYKKSESVKMKVVGLLDTDNGTITVEDVEKNLLSLISDFNGESVELTITVKNEIELEEPTPDEEVE